MPNLDFAYFTLYWVDWYSDWVYSVSKALAHLAICSLKCVAATFEEFQNGNDLVVEIRLGRVRVNSACTFIMCRYLNFPELGLFIYRWVLLSSVLWWLNIGLLGLHGSDGSCFLVFLQFLQFR